MSSDPRLKVVPRGVPENATPIGPTRFVTKDKEEIIELLSKVPTIGVLAAAFAPFVNPYNEGALINVADVIAKEEQKDSNHTILFTVLKGAVEVGRHDKDGEFVQYAIFQPQENSGAANTILFSPDVKLKKLSIRALENDTLIMMIKRDRFMMLLGAIKNIVQYRKSQEKMFHRIATVMPNAKGYRYDIFFVRHLSRLFISYILRATVAQDKYQIDFLTKKITELLDEFNMFKVLKVDQQVKILAKYEEMQKIDKRNWIQDLVLNSTHENPKEIEKLLTVSTFNLHQDLLDIFFEK